MAKKEATKKGNKTPKAPKEEKTLNPITGQPPVEPTVTAPVAKKEKQLILRNTRGEEVPLEDYFYGGKAPSSFEGSCGTPVDREDLLEVFHKVFKPEDDILFYRARDKEVYLVIIPLKYSMDVGKHNDSMEGDFQKHAISFLNEGSVNLDTLKLKLKRIVPFIKFSDR